jgi:hypothetical protein
MARGGRPTWPGWLAATTEWRIKFFASPRVDEIDEMDVQILDVDAMRLQMMAYSA